MTTTNLHFAKFYVFDCFSQADNLRKAFFFLRFVFVWIKQTRHNVLTNKFKKFLLVDFITFRHS